MSFGWGANNASLVSVGSTLATEVYLGTQKVWPIYTPVESPWYSPPGTNGSENDIVVPWPAGAKSVDIIAISGGAGGTGVGALGKSQPGGGAGKWYGITITHDTTVSPPYVPTELRLRCWAYGGYDGAGGSELYNEAADGSLVYAEAGSKWDSKAGGVDKTSPNGRNGGNVDPTFTYKGRTYTLASYGAGAGQGGASSNKNGSDGTRPGGGGQSGDSGGVTGYKGGNGAHGAFKLYWY